MVTRSLEAYSRLLPILRGKGWTVTDLARHLRESGIHPDRKTLYRFAGSEPIGKADIALVRQICDALGVGLEDFFRFAEPLPNGQPNEFWELLVAKVERMNLLGEKSNDGTLTDAERRELADLVAEYEALVEHNAQVRLWRAEPHRFDEAQARAIQE